MSGFYGKIPARGDFVRAGLPAATIHAWDDWAQAALTAARAALAEDFAAAWMEAPVWFLALPAGLCGETALSGVMLPSTDRAGRLFPLLLARAAPPDAAFLARAEAAGRDAIAADLPPETIASLLMQYGTDTVVLPALPALPACGALWWTEGSPRVRPAQHRFPGLPPPDRFASMLDDRVAHE
jgi:type VI secretion system protein ImpM